MPVQRIIIILIYSFGLVGLIAIILSFFDQIGCEGQFVNVNLSPADQQQIWGEQFIGQSFVAPRPDLNRVDLLLQTYGRQNTRDITMRLVEISPDSKNFASAVEHFSLTFNAAAVSDQEWRTFSFPAIPDSTGKTFAVILQSLTSEPGNAITVGGIDKDVYPPGIAFLGPTPIPADIAFRACFQMTASEKLEVLSEQITRNRPAWAGNIAFYLLCLLLYGGVLAGFFWQLTRLITKSN